MANQVIAKQNGQWLVVSLTPDVCKTPRGSSTPAIPYPVIAKLGDAVQVLEHIRSNGNPLVVFDQSQIPKTLGAEAGTAKGVKSGTVNDVCEPKSHSGTVRAGGKPILRHGDEFWMNSRNTIGKIVGETAPASVPAAQANPPLAAETPAETQTGFTILAYVQQGSDLSWFTSACGDQAPLIRAGLAAASGDTAGASQQLLEIQLNPPTIKAPPPAKPKPKAGSPGDGGKSLGKTKNQVGDFSVTVQLLDGQGKPVTNRTLRVQRENGATATVTTDAQGKTPLIARSDQLERPVLKLGTGETWRLHTDDTLDFPDPLSC